MPGLMIHLFAAKKINPDAPIDFFIGNVAPDAVWTREKKDTNHLRNIHGREKALTEFALNMDYKNEYIKGFILHLFVDWMWDTQVISDFAEKHGEGWFPKYREELGIAAAYAFHNTEWSNSLWEQMEQCDNFDFVETEFITKKNIQRLISHQRKWQAEHKIGPSQAFPTKMIDEFVSGAVNDFRAWELRCGLNN